MSSASDDAAGSPGADLAMASACDDAAGSPSDVALQAAVDGNLGLLKIMASKVNLREVKDDKGRNALYLAAEKGHIEVCKFLVEDLGLDVDSVSAEGRRPVHGAAAGGSESVLTYLLARGGDPMMPDSKGKTLLHDAADEGHREAVSFLLSKCSGVPRELIASTLTPLADSNDKDQILKILLEYGADPNQVLNQFFTPFLTMAASKDKDHTMNMLLEHGSDNHERISTRRGSGSGGPVIPDSKGKTPLHDAAEEGHCEALRFLLSKGDNVDSICSVETLLHLAASTDKDQTLKILLEHGADPNKVFNQFFTPFLSASNDQDQTLNMLQEHGSDNAAFMEKERLAGPKSRGMEAFANGNYSEVLYLYGLDSPAPREEIVVVGSGGINGERRGSSGSFPHSGNRGGLLDLIEVTVNYSGRGGGGLRDILEEGVDQVPTKYSRALMSDLCHMASLNTGSRFSKKIPVESARWSLLKKIWETIKPPKRRPVPQPKPHPEIPRAQETIHPKPFSKIHQLYKDIHSAITRFIGYLRNQIPIVILLFCGFVVASGSTLYVWFHRNQAFMVNVSYPGNKIVLVSDDIFGWHGSRLELKRVCNLGTCDVVIPSLVIHCLKTRHTGIESRKTVPALMLIKDLLEAEKVRIFEGPMNPNYSYRENILRTMLMLKLMHPGADVTIATNNRSLRS